jgi:hypothetical protein
MLQIHVNKTAGILLKRLIWFRRIQRRKLVEAVTFQAAKDAASGKGGINAALENF